MSYETEQINTGPLTRCFYGYYSELFIQNSTKSTIVVIDCNNNKINVPPMSGNQIGRETIIIWTRKTTNPTLDHNNTAQNIPGTRTSISLHDLNREGGFYINEINMVLCTEASATTAAASGTVSRGSRPSTGSGRSTGSCSGSTGRCGRGPSRRRSGRC